MRDLYKTPRLIGQVLFVVFLLAVLGSQIVSAQALPPCTESLNLTDDDNVPQAMDIDKNNNGLIEICDLEGLNEIRNNLTGSGTMQQGCPTGGCRGFELTKSLNFTDDASYRTTANRVMYTVANYDDDDDTGWEPIGTSADNFRTTFEGNGHTISNLMINRSTNDIGLLGFIGASADIANIGLPNVRILGGRWVGGLVGSSIGSITNSYATGDVEGAINVGGLVGGSNGPIMNSYATASVKGQNQVGGLVGFSQSGSITNSYATGDVEGIDDSPTNLGGLVGSSIDSITNSYATGSVKGQNQVGGLVGQNSGSIMNSYATGFVSGIGNSPTNLGNLVGQNSGGSITNSLATTLDALETPTMATGIYSEWDPAVWDFGTPRDLPILRSALPPCTNSLLDLPDYEDDNDGVAQAVDIDKDGDGLIEICDLEGLYEMRYALDGSGYSTSPTVTPISMGCPSGGCIGFELTKSLDFTDDASYRIIANKVIYTNGTGWEPIGTSADNDNFRTTFEGNGHTISNLMINRDTSQIGLFGVAGEGANITRIGLLNVRITGGNRVGGLVGENNGSTTQSDVYVTGSVEGDSAVGGLVGFNNNSSIANSYATSDVEGNDAVGGLVGGNDGSITSSYATGSASGNSQVGGLVGRNDGSITSSYATGDVSGINNDMGGLVGQNEGTITNSYATGSVEGFGVVGGLVGENDGGSITNSYATGDVSGIGDSPTNLGGLVGENDGGSITNSYATGDVSGIGDSPTNLGGLVGQNNGGSITNSYATGSNMLVGLTSNNGSIMNSSATTIEILQTSTTADEIYRNWDDTVWDFGTSNDRPKLRNNPEIEGIRIRAKVFLEGPLQ